MNILINYFIQPTIDNTKVFDENMFYSIYLDDENRRIYWDDKEAVEITLYQLEDQVLPNYVLTTDIDFVSVKDPTLTNFHASLYQFAIYGILLVILLRLLKKILLTDLVESKINGSLSLWLDICMSS